MGLIALLGLRLVDLQIVRGSYFEAVAGNQRKRASELIPHRGTIYFQEQNGEELFPVAVNGKAFIAYAVPREMTDRKSVV